jgi:hypothetical protein
LAGLIHARFGAIAGVAVAAVRLVDALDAIAAGIANAGCAARAGELGDVLGSTGDAFLIGAFLPVVGGEVRVVFVGLDTAAPVADEQLAITRGLPEARW